MKIIGMILIALFAAIMFKLTFFAETPISYSPQEKNSLIVGVVAAALGCLLLAIKRRHSDFLF